MRRVLWLTLLCACSRSQPHDPPERRAAQLGAAAEARAAPLAAAARGLRWRGVGTAPLTTETVDGVGQRFVVTDTPCALDLEDGTRVTAAPGAQLWAAAWAKSLLLVAGELEAKRFVAESAAVRIASLAGVIEPHPSAELALRVEPRPTPLAYRAQLSLARGSAIWLAPDAHAAIRETQLIAGEPLPMPPPGLQWLSLPAGPKAQAERAKRFATVPHAPLTADLDALLDAALSEQQALRERGRALLAQASPPADGEPQGGPSARTFQRQLVAHAQRRDAQAKQLLSAAERSLLRALTACPAGEAQACPALRSWIERFGARVASLL
jgi:hypothetical protein